MTCGKRILKLVWTHSFPTLLAQLAAVEDVFLYTKLASSAPKIVTFLFNKNHRFLNLVFLKFIYLFFVFTSTEAFNAPLWGGVIHVRVIKLSKNPLDYVKIHEEFTLLMKLQVLFLRGLLKLL